MSDDVLSMWTVYDHPKDYPNSYVARLWEIGNGPEPKPTPNIIVAPNLDVLRGMLVEMGLTPLARSDGDDPKIVETWL